MLCRKDEVDDRQDKQREQSADRHAADEHDADAVARFGTSARHEDERQMAEYRGCRRHQDGAQARHRCFTDGAHLTVPHLLQFVGECDDENAIFGDQADEGDQADLAVDVDCREAEEGEDEGRR